MAKISKPKLKRYPKRPKASAGLDAWKRFDAKCNEVEKENKARMDAYHKKVREHEAAKKQKLSIINKTKGLSGVAYKGK